ncbi:hypothetical protein D3C75_596880 [compost metagenome]
MVEISTCLRGIQHRYRLAAHRKCHTNLTCKISVPVIRSCCAGVGIRCAVLQLYSWLTKQGNNRLYCIRVFGYNYCSRYFQRLVACGITDIIVEGVDIRFSRIKRCQSIYFTADCSDNPVCQIAVHLIGCSHSGICIFRSELNIDHPISVQVNDRWCYIRLRQGNRTAG